MRIALIIFIIAVVIAIVLGFVRFLFGGSEGDIGGKFGAGQDGGVYISTDGGATFIQHSRVGEKDFSRFDILALLEDPEAPGVWWAATEGSGLYLLRDMNEDWEIVGGEEGVLQRAIIRSLARPRGGTILVAVDVGKRGRIWKSIDGGETFREVYSTAKPEVTVSAVAVPRQESSVVFAGLSDGLLIRSTDAGESWTAVTEFTSAIREIRFAPSDPAVLYARVDRIGVARSRDGGATWEDLSRVRLPSSEDPNAGKPLSRFSSGRQVFSLAIHPSNSQRILLATSAGLLRSEDGGDRFIQLPVPLRPEALPVRAAAFDPQAPTTLHISAGDGTYTSFDDGENWRVTRLMLRPNIAIIGVSSADHNIVLLGTAD